MILDSNVSAVSNQNIGMKIQEHAKSVLSILITLKAKWDALHVLLLHQSGTDKNVWDAPQERFLILYQKLVKVVPLDLFLNLQLQDVYVQKILFWLDQNVLDATHQTFGTIKRKHVFLAHKHFNTTFIRRNVYVLQTDLLNQFH